MAERRECRRKKVLPPKLLFKLSLLLHYLFQLTDTLLHRNCDINEEEERRGREGVVGDDESTYETKSDGQRGDR